MAIINQTEAEAQDSADLTNDFYTDEGVDSDIVAVIGQSNKYFVCSIPFARLAEFNAGDTTLQNNFLAFSERAELAQTKDISYLTVWETEYAKVYP